MDITQAVITGVVQGLTEFLPVSSTGHLVLTSSIYKFFTGTPLTSGGSEEVFFDIMLHIGTLVALIVYFRQDIVNLSKSFLKALKSRAIKHDAEAMIGIYIIIGTLATIAIVLPLKDFFEADMSKPAIVGLQIIVTGLLLFLTEFLSTRVINKVKTIGWKRSVLIGLAQGLAVSPGISRSGATIAAALATGLDRAVAARYSFLLSIPIIAMAAAYDSLEELTVGSIHAYNWPAIVIGTLVSGIVGYYCIKYFISYISSNKLNGYALYCCIIGLLMFLFFSFV